MDDERMLAEERGVSVVRSEEQLRVGVVRVPTERVRLVKHVVTEQVTVQVRREELRVERVPVEAGGTDPGPGPGSDAPLEIVLHEEVVETRVVPRERVRLRVERVTEQRPVSAELRREEVAVERADVARGGAGSSL